MHPHGCVCSDCSWGDPFGKIDLSTVNPDVVSQIIGGVTQITVAGITAASARQPAPRQAPPQPAFRPVAPAPVYTPPPQRQETKKESAEIPTWAYLGAGALILVSAVTLAVAFRRGS